MAMGWSIAVDFVSVHKTQQKEFDQNPLSFLAEQACPTERINISFLSSAWGLRHQNFKLVLLVELLKQMPWYRET